MEGSILPYNVFSTLSKGDRLEALNILIDTLNVTGEVELFLSLIDEELMDGDLSKKTVSESSVKTKDCPDRNKNSRRLGQFQMRWIKESESPKDANGEQICNYITKKEDDDLRAVCKACNVDIYIGNMGVSFFSKTKIKEHYYKTCNNIFKTFPLKHHIIGSYLFLILGPQ